MAVVALCARGRCIRRRVSTGGCPPQSRPCRTRRRLRLCAVVGTAATTARMAMVHTPHHAGGHHGVTVRIRRRALPATPTVTGQDEAASVPVSRPFLPPHSAFLPSTPSFLRWRLESCSATWRPTSPPTPFRASSARRKPAPPLSPTSGAPPSGCGMRLRRLCRCQPRPTSGMRRPCFEETAPPPPAGCSRRGGCRWRGPALRRKRDAATPRVVVSPTAVTALRGRTASRTLRARQSSRRPP